VQKTPDEIRAMAQKALNAFDQVSNDPNALVQANTANYSKAEILYLIAQLDAPATEGYQKALDAFRQVRRKDDMVEIQTHRLEQLKKNSAEALQNGAAGFANTNSRLIDREQGHLTDLQKSADPIIEAYVRMSECYISLKQPEEARTILRRLMIHAYADMPADLKQEVDFQLLYSYVLGGETDQADATLTTYLGKYPADPQADSISYQIGSTLMGKKVPDFEGAVKSAQRSLKDFPKGRFAAQAYAMEAQALSRLGRLDEAKAVLAEAAKLGGTGITADQNLLTTAETQIATGDLAGALSSYQKVIDDAKATDEIRGIAAAGHIRVLMLMQKYDQVVTEAKDFAGKFPSSKAMSGVLLYGALALDKKTPPDEAGAIAGLQDLAKKFPADDTASYALFYVVVINQRMGDMPAMTQAAKALTAAYPKSYTLISNVADLVSAEDVKKKQYADAIALYQPLISAPQHDVAAGAQNKVGDIWLTSAKSMGAFQSMQLAMREDAKNRALSAEQAYLATLTNFSDQVDAVGNAFEGLMNVLVLRRSWGLMKDADLAGYLDKLAAPFTDHDMKTRFDLAKDGLVFVYKNGQKQYADALHQFESSIDPNPDLRLTRQEADQFGELLLAGQKYPDALKVYQDLLDHADKNDEVAQGDGYYGLGATYTAECDVAKAAEYFAKLTKLPGGGMWHPHIQDAQYGLALEAEVKGDPDGSAKKTYSELMQSPTAGIPLQSKALIGYGRLLEKAGFVVKPSADGPNEFAIHYFLEVDTIYGPAVPELSAEGIFDAGQAYEKIGDKVNAKAQYKKLLETYGTTASDWAAKAKEASDKLGA